MTNSNEQLIEYALTELGHMSPEGIAQKFHDLNIKGQRCDIYYCPVANYFKRLTPSVRVSNNFLVLESLLCT
jgi:hypothetical protein